MSVAEVAILVVLAILLILLILDTRQMRKNKVQTVDMPPEKLIETTKSLSEDPGQQALTITMSEFEAFMKAAPEPDEEETQPIKAQ